MSTRVYIGGVHSGQSPAAGLGIARSLRRAFHDLCLIGVEHWQGSSGLHDSTFDTALVLPLWSQIDDELHSRYIEKILDEDGIWIPALDTEIHWMAKHLSRHPRLLCPDQQALRLTEKPHLRAFSALDFNVPDAMTIDQPDDELHRFLRRQSWQCWLKGPYHEARRIRSWSEFEKARAELTDVWQTSRLFLQRHQFGHERSIAFSAYEGELLGAVHLEKRQITPEGKTWGGRVEPLPEDLKQKLAAGLRATRWTGGGEIEYLLDPDGLSWLIECNPRFPAWIDGAAICGMNLPARLVARILDREFEEHASEFPYFTRVVNEIPARESIGLPLLSDPKSESWLSSGKFGKTGSRIPLPNLRTTSEEKKSTPSLRELRQRSKNRDGIGDEITQIITSFDGETPLRIPLHESSQTRFAKLARRIQNTLAEGPQVRVAYSVKTSPTDDHLRLALQNGFQAECISQMEVERALGMGFKSSQIVLNGPGKFWPLTKKPQLGLAMVFCDSLEEFDRAVAIDGLSTCLGFRIRLPKFGSRFGLPIEEFDDFQRLVSRVKKLRQRRLELGFHFHLPSWAIGLQRWMESVEATLLWCRTLEELGGVPIQHLDFGGGFYPGDLFELPFEDLQRVVAENLPNTKFIYFEPGRALTQESEALVSRVLDVRRDRDGEVREVVVDASIAELPLARAYPHRLYYSPKTIDRKLSEPCLSLGKGQTRILGRICMEDDILGQDVELPMEIDVGDLVIFGDSGGYERSMSYDFGRG